MARLITRDVIEAYLQCKVKGHLRLSGEMGSNVDYKLLFRGQDERLHLNATDKLLARHARASVDRKVSLTPAQLKGGASLILDAIWDDARLAVSNLRCN